jgi:hypothetical protein
MNEGEVNTARTANSNEAETAIQWEAIDWWKVEAFIKKAQTRIAKAMVNRRFGSTPSDRTPTATKPAGARKAPA